MKYLYHGSLKSGIKRLTPKISTHGVKYVYAVEHPEVAISFISRASDLDFLRIRYKGKFIVVERRPGAFAKYYKGQAGYLYVVSSEEFHQDKTTWSEELVSDVSVKILQEKPIKDLYKALMRYQHSGKIILYTYEKQPMFVKKLQKSDIVEKIKTWINDENLAKKYLPMVKEKHPDIYEQCKR